MVGAVMGSFAVESFSADRLSALTRDEIACRFRQLAEVTRFHDSGGELPWRNDR